MHTIAKLLFVYLALFSVSVYANQVDESEESVSDTRSPSWFVISFKTTVGSGEYFFVNFTRSYAPLGVDHIWQLFKLGNGVGYYANSGFFRVVPSFVVQFGIAGNPKVSAANNNPIKDDPVLLSNTKGVITYATAGPNTRTTQLFINLGNNAYLDNSGFAGIGMVINGMEVVEKINAQYGQSPDQDQIYKNGNAYLKKNFPKLDYIVSTTLVAKSRN
eukprot:TRINITY_DN119_c0_g1_i1.p1 TRINITY_DN119_c0_g1~~TRINITY_DN119_c0_g1_i1.p1  ORF type:complete len:217 (-),score=46.12 TRINITY_DN119_c0_g1_i1:60-710(-)